MSAMSERFWAKVDKTADDCWLWTGARSRGYGQFSLHGRPYAAHRLAWEMHHGQIPDGLMIDHLCRVRHCVNPDHMELVTSRENTLRGDGPAARNARKTKCVKGHPLDGENLRIKPTGKRVCIACHRESLRRWRSRRREAA